MTRHHRPILVVGGGIGGLSVALALGRRGHPVRVLEQTPELGAIGYGIQLGPNVFPMFDRLGIRDQVLAQSVFPGACIMLDALTGQEVTRVATGASLRARFGHPYIVLHRVDLHHVLMDACAATPGIALESSAAVTGFEDCGDHVVVATEDGRRIDGTALIGCDGLRSRIRAQLIDDGEPRPIGYVAHRTIVPMQAVTADVHRDDVVLWGGPGFHIVTYPLRRKTLFNIVAVFRTATHAEKGDVAAYRAELAHTYREAHPTMRALLAMMDLGRRWPIGDRDPIRHWCKDRVALLGDAAHPTLQTFAQGACMAFEDAVCLAELIDGADGDFAAAFRHYQAARILRTARLQLESRTIWHVYHAAGAARQARNAAWSAWSEQDVFDRLAWLYDGFAMPATVLGTAAAPASGRVPART
jgi:2-polyprenyl-6-methoxyphenol hydroxylase-like FAD-dependent oxidoreductase